jgi:Protein of unknown function (DUF1353)
MHHRWLALALCCIALGAPAQDAAYGSFVGEVQTKWLDDGRKMELLEPFAYIDPRGITWDAPKGWVIDGASIPQFAWSFVGGPYDHKYRDASVIHDVACDRKSRRWEDVHEAFYNAMRASGVESARARIMYAAVYHFGPRWPFKATEFVALDDVGAKTAAVRAQFDPRSAVSVAAEPYLVEGVGVSGAPEKIATGLAKLTITASPSAAVLSEQDMARLAAEIESQGLTLPQIRSYRPK